MTGKTHNAIAFASLVTVASVYPPQELNLATAIVSLVAVSLGALIPDMDQAGSDLWKMLPGGNFAGRVLRRVFYKHRTLTHSLIGTYLIYNIFDFLFHKILNPEFLDPVIILISLMVGYVSHLISDAFTEEGLPLLFPIDFSFGFPPIRSWRIKTGRWFENLIVFPGTWIYVVYFFTAKREIYFQILNTVGK